MAPVVHGLENKYRDKIDFVYLDIDDDRTLPFQEMLNYDRRWRPFIFFVSSDGEIVGTPIIGVQSGQVLEQSLIDFLVSQGVTP
jgi:hypothetical protein